MKKALNIIKSYGFSVCIVIFVMLLAISFKSTLKTEFKKWLEKHPDVKENYPKVSIIEDRCRVEYCTG